MDGLILDTEQSYFYAWQQAAQSLGYGLSHEFCESLSGLPFSILEQRLIQLFGEKFPLKEFYSLSSGAWRSEVNQNGIAVKRGAYELLATFKEKSIPYCLATNSPEQNARECLQYAGIEGYFELMVCRDHVHRPKPAADIFLQAAQVLCQPIESCFVVEDSLTGLLAAKNANAFSVLVPSTQVDEQMRQLAGLICNDLLELSLLLVE